MTILSWHGDPTLKAATIAEMQAHIDADRLVKGRYWEDGKGCAVGCLIKTGDHQLYESKFGIPKELAQLEDVIFEGLPNEKAMAWPVPFLTAVPVGVPIDELRLVWNRLAVWLLIDPTYGVIRFNDDPVIKDVAALHQRVIDGDEPTPEEWEADWAEAWESAESAAGVAARAAAWAAAKEAREAALEAAWAAQADKLLELLNQVSATKARGGGVMSKVLSRNDARRRLNQLSKEIIEAKEAVTVAQKTLSALQKEQIILTQQLNKPVKSPMISDRALLRYIERALGINVEHIRSEILTAERVAAIELGAKSIRHNNLSFKIQNGVITTVI